MASSENFELVSPFVISIRNGTYKLPTMPVTPVPCRLSCSSKLSVYMLSFELKF
jgi:hypothetical protein